MKMLGRWVDCGVIREVKIKKRVCKREYRNDFNSRQNERVDRGGLGMF